MWQVRKLYGGGVPLPPTDPRILALTPEQIELDLAHLAIDDPKLEHGAGSAAFDPQFAEYEQQIGQEAVEEAKRLGIKPPEDPAYEQYDQETSDIEWVDVEID